MGYEYWHSAKIPSMYSELQLQVASKYSCFKFGKFCIEGGRRLLITESLSWKDTISGYSESSTCVLSEHIREEGRPIVCADETYSHTSYAWDIGLGAGLKAPLSKGRHLIIVHAGNGTLNSL